MAKTKRKSKAKKKLKPGAYFIRAIKMTRNQKKFIQRAANKYAKGNFSAWLRTAGLNYKPKAVKAAKTLRK